MAKQSLASAYVQIIPSADGISGSLAEALGGEAATAGKSSGASLGASLVSSLKGFLAAAGIGAMLKSAFTGGTEFETALASGVPCAGADHYHQRVRCARAGHQQAG